MEAPLKPCRVCALAGTDKRVAGKGMSGHLQVHSKEGWSKKSYIERFGPESADDFNDFKPGSEVIAQKTAIINKARDTYNHQRSLELGLSDESLVYLTNPILEELEDDEKLFYEQNFNLYFQAVDRDELQIPHVASLVTDLVSLRRLRKAQLKKNKSKEDLSASSKVEEAITDAEKRIQTAMKSLNLSREAQSKNKDNFKSTSAGLIGGYLDEITRNTVDSLDALMMDEKRVLAQSNERLQELVMQYAPDLEPEEEENPDSDNTGGIFSYKDAVARAKVS